MKNKFKINIFSFLLIFLGILTVINDFYTYFLNTNYIVSVIISLVTTSVIAYVLRNNFKIYNCINKEDKIFYIFLVIVLLMHLPFADEMYDTINYHLYLQERPFTSKLFQDFFPGRYINTFTYAFSDRIFYLFRYFLGYRIGVILNYLLVIIIYYKIKELLSYCTKLKPIYIVLIATFLTFNISLLEQIDNYYVDLLSCTLLLEIFNYAFIKTSDNFKVKTAIYLLLCGMAFSVKISNAFIIILFSLVYLFNNYKSILKFKLKDYIIFILIFIFPFILYLTYTWIQTGNPVFPFYNTIFKSEYYPLSNWMDVRFGPKGLLELLVWPVYAYFEPARVADTHICEPMWAIGYCSSIFYLCVSVINKIRNKKININLLTISIITFMSYLVWSKFMLGYTRYAIIVVLLGSIVTALLILELFKNKNYLIFTILIFSVIVNLAYTGHYYFYSNISLFYDNIFNNTLANYKYNIEHLFDRNENTVKLPDNSVWGVVVENSGDCLLLNNSINIINLTYGAATDSSEKILEDSLKKYDHIYTVVKYDNFEYFFNRLNEYNYDVVEVYDVVTSTNSEDFGVYYIFEITPGNYNDSFEYIYKSKEFDVSNQDEFRLVIGVHPYVRQDFGKLNKIGVYTFDNGEEVLIKQYTNNDWNSLYDIKLDVSNYDRIIVKALDDNGMQSINMAFFNIVGD